MSRVYFEAPHTVYSCDDCGQTLSVRKMDNMKVFEITSTRECGGQLLIHAEHIPQLIKLLQIMETSYV